MRNKAFRHLINFNRNSAELEVQRDIAKWTRYYFWATVVMAGAAIIAAIFTGINMRTTNKMLEQARKDSMLEYRPYVVAKPDSGTVKVSLSDSLSIYEITVFTNYSNPGKTPAISFRSLSYFDTAKTIYLDTVPNWTELLKNQPVSAVLYGNVTQNINKNSQIIVPLKSKAGDRGYLQYKESITSFIINAQIEIPIYYHCLFFYTNFDETEEYYSKFTVCLTVNFYRGNIRGER